MIFFDVLQSANAQNKMSSTSLFKQFCYIVKLDVLHVLRHYRFLFDLLLLGIVLLVENALVFLVSTVPLTMTQKFPLHDTVHDKLLGNSQCIMDFCSNSIIPMVTNTGTLVVLWILFVGLHKQMHIIHQGIRTLTVVRFIRFFTFTSTMLPAPRSTCYATKNMHIYSALQPFSLSWLKQLLTIRTGGACHDLMFSGHTSVYMVVLLCMWASVLSSKRTTKMASSATFSFMFLALCIAITTSIMIALKCMCTIAERHHYSVDIVVAVALTCLAWQIPYSSNQSIVIQQEKETSLKNCTDKKT